MDLRFLTFGGLFLCCCMVCAWCVHGVCVCADACGLHGCVCGCLFLLHVWCVICKHVYSMCRFHCIASVCCYVFLSCFSQGVRHTCMTLNKKIRRCRKVDEWVCVCVCVWFGGITMTTMMTHKWVMKNVGRYKGLSYDHRDTRGTHTPSATARKPSGIVWLV